MKRFFLSIFIVFSPLLIAQDLNFHSQELSVNHLIDGTLLLPKREGTYPLAILVAGSGPTDRNGNQNFMVNNSLKKLAEGLTNKGIATYRYDKRIVKQIRENNIDPNMMFDDFVDDAISILQFFKRKSNFSSIYIIGHSQGSLVSMIASQNVEINGFISIAGSGKPIDQVILEEIGKTAPSLSEATESAFAELRQGKTTTNYPRALETIFNLETQPFIMNWMRYDPQDIIKTLTIPVLIVNGTKDLQVSEHEATLLKSANPDSQLVLIDKMNHIFFNIEGDTLENSKSYNEAFRQISTELIDVISKFILENE